MMIDNLKYNREQARKAQPDLTHGFVYAIQSNGRLLGDEAHAKRKRQRQRPQGGAYTFMSSQDIAALPRGRNNKNNPLHPPSQNCLANIHQLMQQAVMQHQQQTKLPPIPPKPQLSKTITILPQQQPKNDTKDTFPTSSQPPPSQVQSILQQQQQQQQQQHSSTVNHHLSSSNSTATPASNPYHNSAKNYSNNTSQQQPRTENQHPNQAVTSNTPINNPYSSNGNHHNGIPRNNSATVDTSVASINHRNNNTNNNRNNATIVIDDDDDDDDDEFMDDFDDVLANLDVDEVVRGRNSMESSSTSNNRNARTTQKAGSFDYDGGGGGGGGGGNDEEEWGETSRYTRSSSSSHGNASNNAGFQKNNNYQTNNNNYQTNNNSFGNGPVAFNANQYDNGGSNVGQNSTIYDNNNNNFSNDTSSYTNNFNSNYNTSNNNYGNNDYHNDYSASTGNAFQSDNNNNNNNHNNYNTFGTDADSNAPLCPEHNLPCRSLTAKSAINMGREFYKCSLPEGQQCEFFQWADGMEGNWNNNNDYDNATSSGGHQMVMEGGGGGGETKDMYQENQRIFGHHHFRPGQKEVIEQAMKGRDAFVLMPTGGGKSLCYQLPAWCCPGLAVVISPLLSLIQDQVQSMTKVGVQSVFLSSKQDYDTEQRVITERLNQMTSHGGIKILYLTPEKLTHSNQMKRILRQLYQKGLLSRFVVDEAHCLSDWGHDFRPDYNNLGMLRREFPNTPLMALTATANEKVVNDAIRALGMRNHHLYRSSFNRKNLHYQVRKKDGKVVSAIADYIASRPRDSGVVYCLSRKNCEDVSEKLQKILREKGHRNVRVSYYHAELDQKERDRRHHAWSIGQISVLCATIAFGMGIDKPDVRYVIHYSMPKSITHYYQESGRAGRDGDQADCILFYNYKDKKTLESMIRKSSKNPRGVSTRRKIDQLYSCVRYCEDEFRCRRTMQLEFFGENFDRRKCNGTCDNCKAGIMPDKRDMTKVAQELLQVLTQAQSNRKFGPPNVTMNHVAELYRGAKTKPVTEGFVTARIQGYGSGSNMKKPEISRIMHAMVFDRLFVEESTETNAGFLADYLQLGDNAQGVLQGGRKFFVEFPSATKAKKKAAFKTTSIATTKATKKKAAPKTAKGKRKSSISNGTPSTVASDGLEFIEVADGYGDEILVSSPQFSTFRAQSEDVLSGEQTLELNGFIKKIINLWAQEEQAMGNNIHYWNILSNDVVKSVASYCPTSEEELITLGVLGEAKRKEYGERLIQAIRRFLGMKNISVEHIRSKRPVKRAKLGSTETSKPSAPKKQNNEVITIDDQDDEFDEFDTGIDFDAIEIPDASSASNFKKSHYFGK